MAKSKLNKVTNDRFLAGLIVGVLIMLLLWWLAAHNGWGPYKNQITTPKTSAVKKKSGSASASSSSGSNGSNGSSGSRGSSGSGSGSGSTNTALFNLYGSTHNDQTESQVGAQAGGLKPNCVTANTVTPGSKQKVCTYQQGDRVVTITYLDGRVASVSKSGF